MAVIFGVLSFLGLAYEDETLCAGLVCRTCFLTPAPACRRVVAGGKDSLLAVAAVIVVASAFTYFAKISLLPSE